MKPGLSALDRKRMPMAEGLLDYFPAALAVVAECSLAANEQHNPGQPLQHAREKSYDHASCLIRHLIDRGTLDHDGLRHSAKVAWRALALLQVELEAEGWPPARAATVRGKPLSADNTGCKSRRKIAKKAKPSRKPVQKRRAVRTRKPAR